MRLTRVTAAAVTATVLVYTALVIHGFFRTVDHAVYLAADDGLANIAYALGTEGRYGFLTSPMLVGLSRTDGQFNYGPWYFYLAGALVWLFGYSLTLLRSIHLWVIVATVAAARWWFGGRPAALWALFGFGALYAFAQHEWPMFRPDSFVSLFAIAFVVCAGRAVVTGSNIAWFGAGLAAACGALTHLIAWGLVPASAIVWAFATFGAPEGRPDRQTSVTSASALCGGIFVALLMFYASFGFRFGDQLLFLRAYREFTRATSAQNALNTSYFSLLSTHFGSAFGEFPPIVTTLVRTIAFAAWALLLGSLWFHGPARTAVRQYVAPPVIAWTCYFLSLGWYTNLHAGYAILNHVLAVWCTVAVLVVIFDVLRARVPQFAVVAAVVVNMSLIASGAMLISDGTAVTNLRNERAGSWVASRAYVDEVLNALPLSPRAWGSLMFGIENPGRVRMIQFGDAVGLTQPLPPEARAKMAPQFVLWGYPENLASTIASLSGRPNPFGRLDELFPDSRYELVGLVAADPYGVTRVYQQFAAVDRGADRPPLVSVYDSGLAQWSRHLEPRRDVAFAPVRPQRVGIAYGGRFERTATRTLRADLPAGRYVIGVSLGATARSGGGAVMASSTSDVHESVSELGPSDDYSPYGAHDLRTFLVHRHTGGMLNISQLDDDPVASMNDVSVFAIEGIADRSTTGEVARPLPGWRPVGGARIMEGQPGGTVEGDRTQYGYQMMTDLITVRPHTRVGLHVELAVARGRVCIGALDRTQQQWIVPADRPAIDLTFDAGSGGGFYVLVANCNAAVEGNEASRFRMISGSYAIGDFAPYSDAFFEIRRQYGVNGRP